MKRLTKVLVLANLVVCALVVSTGTLRADGFGFWFDCCKTDASNNGFCCNNCCWTTSNCNANSDCKGPMLPAK